MKHRIYEVRYRQKFGAKWEQYTDRVLGVEDVYRFLNRFRTRAFNEEAGGKKCSDVVIQDVKVLAETSQDQ